MNMYGHYGEYVMLQPVKAQLRYNMRDVCNVDNAHA